MLRKFGLDFEDEEELECFLIDLSLERMAHIEENPRPQFYPRFESPLLNKRRCKNVATRSADYVNIPRQDQNMSYI